MNRILLGVLAGITVTTASVGAWKVHAAGRTRDAIAALEIQRAASQTRIADLTQQQQKDAARAAALETETAALKAEVERLRVTKEAARAQAARPRSKEEVERRIEAALHLAQVGDGETALRELRWSLEHGLAALERARRSAQLRKLAAAFVALGARHPAAQAAARERVTNLRAKLLSVGNIDGALEEFVALCHAMHENEAVVALYDQLPAGHSLKPFVGIRVFDDLVKSRRYGDALGIRDFGSMSSSFEMNRQMTNLPHMLTYAVKEAGKNIEVLAGAGEVGLARELAQRVVKADGSAGTLRLLREHLELAGRPEVLDTLGKTP